MLDCLNSFIEQCHTNLLIRSEGEVGGAVSYLDSRKVSLETMTEHNIGYCFKKQDIPKEIQFFGRKEDPEYGKGYGLSHAIRGRIIVPVYEEFNNIVGFATREPSFDKGKAWWNLPKPFYKGNHLFLLNKARKAIFDANKVYLVEGYMDALLLYQNGIHNVCGLMGTALTQRKISLIMRYCNNVCLCMDCDENEAGQAAQEKAIYILNEFGFCENISIISTLTEGVDPAKFLEEHTAKELLEGETILSEKKIAAICRKVIESNPKKKCRL